MSDYAITTLTTVGYGDRTPATLNEKVFSVFTEVAGGIVFGLLAGTLGGMLAAAGAADAKVEGELDELTSFMLARRVKKDVRNDVVAQMQNYYKAKGVFDEQKIMRQLPNKFKKQLLLSMYKPQLLQCPLFLGLDDVIVTQVAILMQPYLAVRGDEIMLEEEVGDEMFMIIKGEVKLTSKRWPRFNGRSWVDGAFLGELPVLGLGGGPLRNRHIYSAEAESETDLTFLTSTDLDEMERDYPELKKKIRRLASQRAERFGAAKLRSCRGVVHTLICMAQ